LEAGLGDANSIESIEIWWAGNPKKKSIYKNIAIDHFIELTEGDQKVNILQRKPNPLKGNGAARDCCKK
jgi:hypothetical protein